MKTTLSLFAATVLGLGLASTAAAQAYEDPQDIVDVASANEDFSTLVTAIEAAGLAETLQGEGPFTVFAPNNAAFEALPEGKLDKLMKPENKEKLATILQYHVVPGKLMATDVAKLDEAMTAVGDELDVEVAEDGAVTIEGANLVRTDIETSNGVIHVIDKVLVPERPADETKTTKHEMKDVDEEIEKARDEGMEETKKAMEEGAEPVGDRY